MNECDFCGGYSEILTWGVCPDCVEKHHVCSACGEVSENLISGFCEDCARTYESDMQELSYERI
jgi:NMD protein affecting ribosome stability and mRNA decay